MPSKHVYRPIKFHPDQYILPLHLPALPILVSRRQICYKLPESATDIFMNKKKPEEPEEYSIGVSIVTSGPSPVVFGMTRTFGVLEVLKPHIGYRSAVLLELLGYHELSDLVRTRCLSSIPSIGPKKREKILSVLEGFGFAPPRQPAPVSKHWQRLFDSMTSGPA